MPVTRIRLFGRGTLPEAGRIAHILRRETVGGALLLTAAILALAWANSPWSESYEALRDARIGPVWAHLDLTLAQWASDGLLAVFFFVAGLELKREFVAGDLRDPRRAAVPIAAAVGGVLMPALLYTVTATVVSGGTHEGAGRGWAIPTATDIAFALAVLAVVGRHLPAALRTFLLTLAVVDDLIAITIIAIFYTDSLAPIPLLAAAVPLGLFAVLVQRQVRAWWLLMPLAVTGWALMHASGIHATVAGVLLGFAVPVLRSRPLRSRPLRSRPLRSRPLRSRPTGVPEAGPGLAEHFEHRFRPLSSGLAVPVFAFFSAGVTIGGFAGLRTSLADPVTLGVVAGLVIGKPAGIMAATWAVSRFTRADLDDGLTWVDVLGLGTLAGIGFTVSLLIGELAFGVGSAPDDHVKVGVLTGSIAAALLATALLRLRNRAYRRLAAQNADASR